MQYLNFLNRVLNANSGPYSFNFLIENSSFKENGWDLLKRCILDVEGCSESIRGDALTFMACNSSLFRSKEMVEEAVGILKDIIIENEYSESGDAAMVFLYVLRSLIPEGSDGILLINEHVYKRLRASLVNSDTFFLLDCSLNAALGDIHRCKKRR